MERWAAPLGDDVRVGFSERRDGDMRLPSGPGMDEVLARRLAHLRSRHVMGVLAAPLPVHGVAVAAVRGDEPTREGHVLFAQADALVAAVPGVALTVTAADCLPVFFSEPRRGLIGLAHAGWRGLLHGVLEATVAELAASGGDPALLRAAVGPSIGPCHYAVDAARRAAFVERFGDAAVRGEALDLRTAARIALVRAGVAAASGIVEPPCTACQAARFFSHRIDRTDPPATGMAWIVRGR